VERVTGSASRQGCCDACASRVRVGSAVSSSTARAASTFGCWYRGIACACLAAKEASRAHASVAGAHLSTPSRLRRLDRGNAEWTTGGPRRQRGTRAASPAGPPLFVTSRRTRRRSPGLASPPHPPRPDVGTAAFARTCRTRTSADPCQGARARQPCAEGGTWTFARPRSGLSVCRLDPWVGASVEMEGLGITELKATRNRGATSGCGSRCRESRKARPALQRRGRGPGCGPRAQPASGCPPVGVREWRRSGTSAAPLARFRDRAFAGSP
jgi:hypothetical protein